MRLDLFRFAGSHFRRVAILLSYTSDGLAHSGILYRDDNGDCRLQDFQIHSPTGNGNVVDRQWKGKYPHVVLDIDSDSEDNIAATCQVIRDRYMDNPKHHLYSFVRHPNAGLTTEGDLYLGDEAGATCASFVLILLSTANIELVAKGDQWPYRGHEDKLGYERLLTAFEEWELADDALFRLRDEIAKACPRVAPTEVAVSAMCPFPPATQEFAERGTKWIIGLLDYKASNPTP